MNSLRMETAFKGSGELIDEVTLPEAGVMRFARSGPAYLGREETLHRAPRGTCAYLEIEPDGVEDGHDGEAVLRDGAVVGFTCSVACVHSAGSILAPADVGLKAATLRTALAVLIAGTPCAARVPGEAAHDPGSLCPRAEGRTGARG